MNDEQNWPHACTPTSELDQAIQAAEHWGAWTWHEQEYYRLQHVLEASQRLVTRVKAEDVIDDEGALKVAAAQTRIPILEKRIASLKVDVNATVQTRDETALRVTNMKHRRRKLEAELRRRRGHEIVQYSEFNETTTELKGELNRLIGFVLEELDALQPKWERL